MNHQEFLIESPNDFFKDSPLVHCITNEITAESVANALLYVNSKPIMATDTREFSDIFKQSDALLLNLGHLSKVREEELITASEISVISQTPTVVDIVGINASSLRKELSFKLLKNEPKVVKGNTSELRALCGLKSSAKGVDGHVSDQSESAIKELILALKRLSDRYPNTCFLATGKTDVIVTPKHRFLLKNGVEELDKITGTGDVVGALIASLLAQKHSVQESLIAAVSYFNICGENALKKSQKQNGLEIFKSQLFDELSTHYQTDMWWQEIKGEKL